MTNNNFLIKIIPPQGYNVYRLHVSRLAAGAAVVGLVALILGGLFLHAWQLHAAEENVRELQAQTAAQRDQLTAIGRQADSLGTELRVLQRENSEIRRLLGAGAPAKAAQGGQPHAAVSVPADMSFGAVKARLAAFTQASRQTLADQKRLARLTHRLLNFRRLAVIARGRMLAAIPSINPVGGGIASAFGYRLTPWPEFHAGVDLEADYGTPVHAAADGVIAATGWDGGFGNKVDLDHGNGYHTWYAHLSRFAVHAGERIRRGQVIAFVGATGAATGPHLHYQLMVNGTAVNPVPFLNGIPREVLATLPAVHGVQ